MTFLRVLRESGLTKAELASLYGVSRQSIYRWKEREPPPANWLVGRMAIVITAALEMSIDRKILPLGAMSREARAARIARMTNQLQGLKPAPAK